MKMSTYVPTCLRTLIVEISSHIPQEILILSLKAKFSATTHATVNPVLHADDEVLGWPRISVTGGLIMHSIQ